MKKNSLEYLVDNMHLINSTKWKEVLSEAKKIHKKEIMDAHQDGYCCSNFFPKPGVTEAFAIDYYKDYYNDTFTK